MIATVTLSHGRGWLTPEAAASIERLDAAKGSPWQITEAGRTWEQQNAHWLNYQRNGSPIALHPDTPSIHQLGNAIDTDDRDVAMLNDHGWFQTVFRHSVLVEPWHFEYATTRDNHYSSTDVDTAGGGSADQMIEGLTSMSEAYVAAPNGTVAHLRTGGKINFKNPAHYHRHRNAIKKLRRQKATGLMLPPTLAKVPRVSWTEFETIADAVGAPKD